MYMKLMEHIKKKNDLNNEQLGIVVYNKDPLKKGRVKVIIQELLTDSSNNYEKLPWVYPSRDFGITGGKGTVLDPPELNARLKIKFTCNDINFPTYTGYWSDNSNYLSFDEIQDFNPDFKLDYPNVYGYQDSEKNYTLINKKKGYLEKKHFDKILEKIDKEGNYTLIDIANAKFEFEEKFEIIGPEINLGILNNIKALIQEGHLDKFEDLLTVLNTIFSFLTVIDTISGGAYTSTILPQWISTYNNLLLNLNNDKTENLKAS